MRKLAVLIIVLAVSAPVWAQVMAGAYSIGGAAVVEDFDSMGVGGTKAPGPNFLQTYWSATSNNNTVEWATSLNNPEGTGPNGDSWGGAESCYNAAGIPDGAFQGEADRTLGVYKSQPSAVARLTTRFINNTGADLTALTLSFDHELKWSAFADPSISGQERAGEFRLQYSLDNGATWQSAVTYAGTANEAQSKSYLDNVGIPLEMSGDTSFVDFTRGWLTDQQMEDLGKVHRGVGGVVQLSAAVPAGGEVRLRWDGWVGVWGDGTPGNPKDSNMLHGIDNMRVVQGALPGDIDVTGTVGLSDLSILAGNYGTTDKYWGQGDLDGDGNVALADLSILAGNYGQTTLGAVPEPAALSLLLAGGLVAVRRRK